MIEKNASIVRRFWESVEHAPRESLSEFFTQDYVRHSLHADLARDDFLKLVQERLTAFPDLKTTIFDTIEQDEKVAYRWESVGTHLATYLNIPATNRKVSVRGITISRIDGGRIAEDWSTWETLNVLHSLSVFPL